VFADWHYALHFGHPATYLTLHRITGCPYGEGHPYPGFNFNPGQLVINVALMLLAVLFAYKLVFAIVKEFKRHEA